MSLINTNFDNKGILPFMVGAVIGSACIGFYYKKIGNVKPNKIKVNDEVEDPMINKKENKIKEVNNAPLELRKRFENKGYVFVHQNLATVNVELNEFVELMRKYDLFVLNGCQDPDNCKCTFRHKRCRLFMIRKYSNADDMQYFTPSCNGVTVISPSNTDIQNGTTLHEFVQMFQNKFSDRVMDLVSYVNYIIDPRGESDYVVDVTLIADPYLNHKTMNRYGYPNYRIDNLIKDNDSLNKKCSLAWHQDHFIEVNTKQTHAYDVVAMFILNAKNISSHKLMIGKLKTDIDTSAMTLEQIQEHIILSSAISIENDICSDIGYIIDQRQNFFHKHSDFEYLNNESRRNVITIRIKYLK